MSKIRLIARLDIKGQNLIKGIQLEGLRVIGPPKYFIKKYYEDGIDEIVFMDSVASLYGRNNLTSLLKEIASDIFIPITVGGGIRSLEDAQTILRSGADKVAINTSAVNRPDLISEVAKKFGSQCMVLSVEAKSVGQNKWEVLTEGGRERTGKNAIKWIQEAVERGAGEVLLTSVDREGTRSGFDLELLKAASSVVNVPIIASGGMGEPNDLLLAVKNGGVTAVAMADILHYKRYNLKYISSYAKLNLINVR